MKNKGIFCDLCFFSARLPCEIRGKKALISAHGDLFVNKD